MPDGTKLLIIDDDQTLVNALRLYLSKEGYQVLTAANGLEGLQTLYNERPDIVLLDIMMPKLDGWEVCRRIREMSDVPVIMLTARDQENDRVMGLKMGADDYISKPFSLKELEARLEAVLRRTQAPTPVRGRLLYCDEYLTIDADRWEVRRNGELVDLTPTELRLLLVLAENAGRVVSHQQLLEQVWGSEYVDETDYTKLFIWRLRQKIEPDPANPRYILTERGLGYRFARGGGAPRSEPAS